MFELLGWLAFVALLVFLFRNREEPMSYQEYKKKHGSMLDKWD